MSKDILIFQKNVGITPESSYQITRAKSFKVIAPAQNYPQYIKTVKAYALAGLPFEHIANAGVFLGDNIEKGEIDASIEANWQDKIGEIAEDENKILAWQNRGERIQITRQLEQTATSGNDLVKQAQNLVVNNSEREQTLNVVEGIAVYNQKPQSLPNASNSDSELENNPYLKVPPMNKAA